MPVQFASWRRVAPALVEVLGLEGRLIRSVTVRVEAGGVAEVVVEELLPAETAERFVAALRRFRFAPIDDQVEDEAGSAPPPPPRRSLFDRIRSFIRGHRRGQ